MKRKSGLLLLVSVFIGISMSGCANTDTPAPTEIKIENQVTEPAETTKDTVKDTATDNSLELDSGNEGEGSEEAADSTELESGYIVKEGDLGWDGSIYYEVKDGKAIYYYDKEKEEIKKIPEKLGGYVISGLGYLDSLSGSFSGDKILKEISLPDTLEYIGGGAFGGCINLKKITFGKGVKQIGESAFMDTGLETIEIPENIQSIDTVAFAGCSNLKEVTIISPDTKIESGAFVSCHDDLIIKAPAGSNAERYAKENEIKFEELK